MKKQIGAYEAKSTLPELLRKTANGESFTITNRGKPVADIVPHKNDNTEVVAAIKGLMMNMSSPIPDDVLEQLKPDGRD